MKKIADILLYIFSVGIFLCLIAGGLSLLGYMIALILGGNNAVSICTFIFTSYLPCLIRITTVITGLGLLGMYLSKIKALSISNDKE